MDPFYHSSGFLDLLQSQTETHRPKPSLHESLSPRSNLGESEVPVQAKDRKSRKIWTPTEDVVLISAWLNTSKDPIVANEQRLEAFWKRIAAYVAASPKLNGKQVREDDHCKQRWGKINISVCKFVGCYDAALLQKSSGQTDNDVMKLAHEIYFNDLNKKFMMVHAWRELRHDQKWCQKEETRVAKRRKFGEGSTQSPGSNTESQGDDSDMARPMGVKAAKAKAKAKASTVEGDGKVVVEFQKMWEIKQKDIAAKNKLTNKMLLKELLGKTESLTDIETALKNQLIAEMLSNA